MIKRTRGPLLDAEIAIRLFGWSWCRCEYIGPSHVPRPVIKMKLLSARAIEDVRSGWKVLESNIDHTDTRQEWTPRYSQDIAAAWQVVEKLLADGFGVYLTRHDDSNEWNCTIGRGDKINGEIAEAVATTAPVAICRAALLAVAEVVKGTNG